jgi:hypothetical protein
VHFDEMSVRSCEAKGGTRKEKKTKRKKKKKSMVGEDGEIIKVDERSMQRGRDRQDRGR